MLELIRRNKLVTQIILLVFIVPSFIFFGVQGYDMLGDRGAPVKVDGKVISEQEWENAKQHEADGLRQRLGDKFDSKLIESPEFKWIVLEKLIGDRVVQNEIADAKLTVTDETVIRKIRERPGLTKPDGTFNTAMYKEILKAQGITEDIHFILERRDLIERQVASLLMDGFIFPRTILHHIWDINEQEREIQLKQFKATDYYSQVKLTDEELKDFYTKNIHQFMIPEHVTAEMIVLDLPTLEESIRINDADVKSYYEQNKQRFGEPEQRRARQIMLNIPKDAFDSDHTAAKEKMEKLLAQVRANPSSFAELAKEHSQDPESALNGGDMGYITHSAVDKDFADALFALGKKGDISNVIKTNFGYHIIMLEDIRPRVDKSLAEVRKQVEDEIRKQEANKKFTEYAEIFTNTVYEQPDSLKPTADKLNLQVLTVQNLTRDPNIAYAGHVILSNPKFLKALYSDEVLKNKNNSEAIEISPQLIVATRIAEHFPAKQKPFDEVKGNIEKVMTAQKAGKLAKAAGEAELARLKAGEEPKGFSPSATVSLQMINMTGRTELLPVIKADASSLPAYIPGEDFAEGYIIFRINKVTMPEQPNIQVRQILQNQMISTAMQQEMLAYMNYLQKKHKVERLRTPETEKAEAMEAGAADNTEEK